ncbi:lamin tail domain-containing protein [Marinomonas sp. THO17]|uniref:lamin tail domain-containing protein n=1 Tax=Marinomonas sp. THO17 TaxID=3149048 RepID=UPI00336C0963
MSYFNNRLQNAITEMLKNIADCPPISRLEADALWDKLNKLQAFSQVVIDKIEYDNPSDPLDEYVTIRNRGGLQINLSGWRLQAGSPKQVFTFPENSLLFPYDELRLMTSGDHNYSFRYKRPIWNNQGDLGTLYDDQNNALCSLAYGKSAHDKIVISHMHYDGQEHRSEGDEFVEISNLSDSDVMLDDWRLEAITNNHVFQFPKHTKLDAFTSLKVYTNKIDLKANEFSFDSPQAIWNNSGGGCKLLDYQREIVSEYLY